MITILGQVPSKKNSRINTRSGRSFPSKRYSAWHKDATTQLRASQQAKYENKVEITYMFYVQDLRRRDISNMIESVNDLLVDEGIVPDDDWQHLVIGYADAQLDRENPRVELAIKEL